MTLPAHFLHHAILLRFAYLLFILDIRHLYRSLTIQINYNQALDIQEQSFFLNNLLTYFLSFLFHLLELVLLLELQEIVRTASWKDAAWVASEAHLGHLVLDVLALQFHHSCHVFSNHA